MKRLLAVLLLSFGWFFLFHPTTVFTTTLLAAEDEYLTPRLNVNIPNVSFSKITEEGGVLSINFIGEYVSGFYKYLIGISVIIAVVMIMVGGAQYVATSGSGNVTNAKERIRNAVTGLVLLMSVVLIIYTVNPNLTFFKPLNVQVVPPPPQETEDDSVTSPGVVTNFEAPNATNIIGPGVNQVPKELKADIEAAAKVLEERGLGMSITSSFRSVEDQMALINQNCNNPPGSATCDPKSGKAQTCILKDNNPANCPHTTGRALDIWATGCTGSGKQCVTQKQCLENKTACFAHTGQSALIDVMKAQGFCVLGSEPWHFEKPKMSSNCN